MLGVIDYLEEKKAHGLPDIFVRPVQAANVRELLKGINAQDSSERLWNLLEAADMHVVASVLKLHFRSMKVPVIPHNLYDDMVLAAVSGSTDDALALEVRPMIATLATETSTGISIFFVKSNIVTPAKLAYTWGPASCG